PRCSGCPFRASFTTGIHMATEQMTTMPNTTRYWLWYVTRDGDRSARSLARPVDTRVTNADSKGKKYHQLATTADDDSARTQDASTCTSSRRNRCAARAQR